MKFYLKLILVFILATLVHQVGLTQDLSEPDEVAIKSTVEMYFDGWLTGDTTKLGKAMHITCQLKNVKDDKCKVYDRKTYLGFFNPREKLQDAGGKILSIDITNNIAAVKCQLISPKKVFIDYFNMMKFKDGNWYIVDKVSTNRPRRDTDTVPIRS